MTRRPVTVHLTSLGCAKNTVDSQTVAAQLHAAGAVLVSEPDGADIALVNTCTFIEDASQESVDAILELAELRRSQRCGRLVVFGCLAQRYGDELRELIPEVDVLAGTGALGDVVRCCLDRSVSGVLSPAPEKAPLAGAAREAIGASAYVKVGEGCSQKCSFCIIPKLRGPLRTRPIAEIVDEVSALSSAGIREVNLVGQDTTAFGRDRSGKERLADLLLALDRVEGLDWIRVLYAYPARLSDRLIEAIATCDRVCNYLDIPLQHVDEAVLRSMGRGTSERTVREVVRRLRRGIPQLTLRSTFLVGFPGETDDAFQRLRDFVEECRFERVGVFAYSAEEGTPAASMDGQVPQDVAHARREELLALQSTIHREHNQGLVGTRCKVLVEGLADGLLRVGRTSAQAPEVDGVVILDGGGAEAGEMVEVEVTGCDGYDLVGVLTGKRWP